MKNPSCSWQILCHIPSNEASPIFSAHEYFSVCRQWDARPEESAARSSADAQEALLPHWPGHQEGHRAGQAEPRHVSVLFFGVFLPNFILLDSANLESKMKWVDVFLTTDWTQNRRVELHIFRTIINHSSAHCSEERKFYFPAGWKNMTDISSVCFIWS